MKLEIRTLTPLWTGGVNAGKVDRIHETGILGSLRWWYEAIVRGLGGEACDPSQGKCIYDPEKLDHGLCDVCQVFGATGWRRRFRLEMVNDNTLPIWKSSSVMLNVRPPDRTRGWYLPPGRMGQFSLHLSGDEETLSLLAALFLFLERWGSLGAKPQLGYGLFEIINRDDVGAQAERWPWQEMGSEEIAPDLPDLRRFGFFRYRFQPKKPTWWTQVPGIERVVTKVSPLVGKYNVVPVTPALKNEWRFRQWQRDWGDPRKFFGMLHPNRIRSKVSVSWAYNKGDAWEIRGSAWLSQDVRQPQAVWAMFSDRNIWHKIVGVGGELASPAASWQPRSTTAVKQFLEATK